MVLEQHPKVELSHKVRPLVRPFRESDSEDVRKLFTEAMISGSSSTLQLALKHQVSQPPALVLYTVFALGLALAFTGHLTAQVLGAILAASTFLLFLEWKRNSKKQFRDFIDSALIGDLANIQKQYGSHPSGFWVAEVAEGSAAGKVIGCVGLDSSTKPDPKTVELRRMVVSPSYQGHGVGKLLLTNAIAYARAHGLSDIVLSTGMFQKPAIMMYERFGFVEEKRVDLSVRFLFLETKFHVKFYILKL